MIMFMQLELVHPGIRRPDHALTMYSSFLHMNYETKCINNYRSIWLYRSTQFSHTTIRADHQCAEISNLVIYKLI